MVAEISQWRGVELIRLGKETNDTSIIIVIMTVTLPNPGWHESKTKLKAFLDYTKKEAFLHRNKCQSQLLPSGKPNSGDSAKPTFIQRKQSRAVVHFLFVCLRVNKRSHETDHDSDKHHRADDFSRIRTDNPGHSFRKWQSRWMGCTIRDHSAPKQARLLTILRKEASWRIQMPLAMAMAKNNLP